MTVYFDLNILKYNKKCKKTNSVINVLCNNYWRFGTCVLVKVKMVNWENCRNASSTEWLPYCHMSIPYFALSIHWIRLGLWSHLAHSRSTGLDVASLRVKYICPYLYIYVCYLIASFAMLPLLRKTWSKFRFADWSKYYWCLSYKYQ